LSLPILNIRLLSALVHRIDILMISSAMTVSLVLPTTHPSKLLLPRSFCIFGHLFLTLCKIQPQLCQRNVVLPETDPPKDFVLRLHLPAELWLATLALRYYVAPIALVRLLFFSWCLFLFYLTFPDRASSSHTTTLLSSLSLACSHTHSLCKHR
jgi:hypothetical protein